MFNIDNKEINIYCDESCHLQNETEKYMFVSCICCPKESVRKISNDIQELKQKYKIWRFAEIKWTKVSASKEEFYYELLNLFLKENCLRFRTIIIPDKTKLQHEKFGQDPNSWYYKMIYQLVKYLVKKQYQYNVYIDKKENSYQSKFELNHMKQCLERHFKKDFHVQNIRSHESELMQLNDFLQGIVSYCNRSNILILNLIQQNYY